MRVASLRAECIRSWRRLLVIALGLCAVMTAVTALAGNASWATAFMFWSAVILLIGAWIWREEVSRRRTRVRRFESALRDGEVRELRVHAVAVAEFEEAEDEGASYAFDLGNGTVLFISGQDFYMSRSFPNTDFSLIEIHDVDGELVELYIEKRGRQLEVSRTITAKDKKRLRIPEHLQCVEGQLPDIERVLAQSQ